MTSRGHYSEKGDPDVLSDRLKLELKQTTDGSKRVSLLHALSRLFEDKPADPPGQSEFLDSALDLDEASLSLAWDTWRLADQRTGKQKVSALANILEDSSVLDDKTSPKLWLSRIRGDQVGDSTAVSLELQHLGESEPNNIGVALALAEFSAAKGRPEDLAKQIEEIANNTGDTRIRAALLTEAAAREHGDFSEKSRVLSLLGQALGQPDIDWLATSDIAYLSSEIGDFELQEKALQKMADAALDGEGGESVESDSEFPIGHDFSGFEMGKAESAVLWWKICQIREQRLANPEQALEALDRARELLPNHDFLELERVRLLEACGRPDEALEASTSKVPGAWKAQLALAAELPQSAVITILSEDESTDSPLGEALAEVIGEATESSPDLEGSTESLLLWFQTHPRHPEAPAAAKKLTSLGIDIPAVRLSVWENADPGGKWPEVVRKETDEAWPLALDAAILSESDSVEEKAEAYVEWANSTSDLTFSAKLLAVAARLHEREGGSGEAALENYREAEILNPEDPDYGSEVLRLMHELGEWEPLADQLADEAAVAKDEASARAALMERAFILDRALNELSDAKETLAELVEQDPGDVHALWFLCQVAFRMKDWRLFSSNIAKLAELCPEDEPLLTLLEGEVQLFQIGNFDEALHCFESASTGPNPTVSRAARRYILLVYYELGDFQSLLDLLRSESGVDSGEYEHMWFPELFEAGRAAKDDVLINGTLSRLEGFSPFKILQGLLSGTRGLEYSAVVENICRVANEASNNGVKGSCLASAALLNGDWSSFTEDDGRADYLDSKEALWHVADNANFEKPVEAVRVYKKRAEMAAASGDPEWTDWVLATAQAQEKTEGTKAALSTVNEALENSPKHLGLLFAKLLYAKDQSNFPDIVDAHKRLAAFYSLREEKATHLAKAARVLSNEMRDFESARDLCIEALRYSHDHAEANAVLMGAYKVLGDESSVAKFIENKIDEKSDKIELVTLYEEQADQMFAMDDNEGAIEALDKLIEIAPERLSAHLTKIEILIGMARYEEAVEAMSGYVKMSEDQVEIRSMVWRGADLIAEELKEVDGAIEWLEAILESGDRHPNTLKKIIEISKRADNWEDVADALERLAALQSNEDERIETLREEAEVRLEQLFDDEAATEIVKTILKSRPGDLPTLEMTHRLRGAQELEGLLEKAIEATRAQLDENPVSIQLVEKLRRLAEMAEEKDLTSLCEDILLLLNGEKQEPWPGDLVPGAELDSETKRRFFVHPLEKRSPSRVAEMASEISAKALQKHKSLPDISKKTLVGEKAGDTVKNWVNAWARLLGYEKVDVHRISGLPKPARAVPKNIPALVIASSLKSPLPSRHRFFLARNIWRSARGLGAFEEGDTAGPVRWVIAVTVAILGERIELPVPTDAKLVTSAKKAMPRRLRRSLNEPCDRLLKENRQSLRGWSQAISYSADRFGLLAATRIAEVIPCIIEEETGDKGLERFKEDPGGTLMKIPRCRELLRFTLSEEYLDARRQVNLGVRGSGGTK